MKAFIEKLQSRFNQFNCREKVFLLLFIWGLNIVFIDLCIKQTKTLTHRFKVINAKIDNCQHWIENTAYVNDKFDIMMTLMDPEKTYSGAAFAGEVESAVRENGINYSMQLHCTNAPLQRLIAFEDAIYQKKPYLSMEKVKIHANLFNPELLEVDFSLSALQLKDLRNEN